MKSIEERAVAKILIQHPSVSDKRILFENFFFYFNDQLNLVFLMDNARRHISVILEKINMKINLRFSIFFFFIDCPFLIRKFLFFFNIVFFMKKTKKRGKKEKKDRCAVINKMSRVLNGRRGGLGFRNRDGNRLQQGRQRWSYSTPLGVDK